MRTFSGICGPHIEVISKQLEDECRVAIAVFSEGVELGQGAIESRFRDFASSLGILEDVELEH